MCLAFVIDIDLIIDHGRLALYLGLLCINLNTNGA
jgi:hypothetical protein